MSGPLRLRRCRAEEERLAADAAARAAAADDAAARAEASRTSAVAWTTGFTDGFYEGFGRGRAGGCAGDVASGAADATRLFSADLAAARAELEAEVKTPDSSACIFKTLWICSCPFIRGMRCIVAQYKLKYCI